MPFLLTLLSTVALALVSLTMLARANDLGTRPGLFWMVRRVGFVLCGFAPWAIMWIDINAWLDGNVTLTWWHVLHRCGLAMVFLTTPYLPPWWKWFLGIEATDPKWSDDRRGMPHRRKEDAS